LENIRPVRRFMTPIRAAIPSRCTNIAKIPPDRRREFFRAGREFMASGQGIYPWGREGPSSLGFMGSMSSLFRGAPGGTRSGMTAGHS
jgi:hypothetical protein